jgi:hypothetical protein
MVTTTSTDDQWGEVAPEPALPDLSTCYDFGPDNILNLYGQRFRAKTEPAKGLLGAQNKTYVLIQTWVHLFWKFGYWRTVYQAGLKKFYPHNEVQRTVAFDFVFRKYLDSLEAL